MQSQEVRLFIRKNSHFQVKTDREIYRASRIVLAMGRRGTPRKLNVPGEELPKVMYRLMDAESYRNEHILVVGGGDSAVEAAIALSRQKGNTVTLSYRKDTFFRIKKQNEERIQALMKCGQVNILFNSIVKSISGKTVLLKTYEGDIEIPNDYVFIFAGGEPPFTLMKNMGIRFGRD